MKFIKTYEAFTENRIECDSCGWEWKLEEGGDDLYICHECGHDNTPVLGEAKRPEWQDSDFPDAEGRFSDLSIKDLAAWLIKTRKKDLKAISGSLTQQVVFNRNEDPKYAEKMEKVRKEVYKQLGRKDLLDKMDESLILEIGDASAKPFKWKSKNNVKKEMTKLFDKAMELPQNGQSIQAKDQFDYFFKNDNGIEYIVRFEGFMEKDVRPNFSGRPMGNLLKYQSIFNLAYNLKEDSEKGVERTTNLGDHFRIMSTVTQIAYDFLKNAEDSGYPVKKLVVAAKGDASDKNTMDSRRGRMYTIFVKKQMSNLKTQNKYSVTTNQNEDGSDEIVLILGDLSGSNVIAKNF